MAKQDAAAREPAPEPELRKVEQELAPAEHKAEHRFDWLINLPPVARVRKVLAIYGHAGGTLLAEGLAYSALFAGLTGLLLCVGLLGYVVPSEADRQRMIDSFTGQLAPFADIARDGLTAVAANASAFSVIGILGLAWGTSHFYGAMDVAVSRIFDRTPTRGGLDRIVRGFASLLLLVGGLAASVFLSAIQAWLRSGLAGRTGEELAQAIETAALLIFEALLAVVVVAIVYRIVPNVRIPVAVLWLPALIVGLAVTVLSQLLVVIAPLLTGALSVFGGVAAVLAALAWLNLVFQVLLIGASWTRVRLEDRVGNLV
jgi:membrane protein